MGTVAVLSMFGRSEGPSLDSQSSDASDVLDLFHETCLASLSLQEHWVLFDSGAAAHCCPANYASDYPPLPLGESSQVEKCDWKTTDNIRTQTSSVQLWRCVRLAESLFAYGSKPKITISSFHLLCVSSTELQTANTMPRLKCCFFSTRPKKKQTNTLICRNVKTQLMSCKRMRENIWPEDLTQAAAIDFTESDRSECNKPSKLAQISCAIWFAGLPASFFICSYAQLSAAPSMG